MKRISIFLTVFAISLNLISAQNKATNTTFTLQDSGPIYVNATAGGGNGVSWANAYTSLQSALNTATSGDEIWVAKGTYKPSTQVGGTGTRFQTFQMINGVSIYGGFAGNETTPSARATYGVGEANETILSGDIGTANDNSDNCYNVFYHPDGTNLNSTAILDGFTITKGNANGSHLFGGGMSNYSSSPTITNSTFCDNNASFGGGMYNEDSSDPIVANSTFVSNSAESGGGMSNYNASPTVTNSIFSNNNATDGGGGMSNRYSSSPTVTNSTFINNNADNGGGMYNYTSSSPIVTNSTFINNNADNGGGMYNYSSSSPTVTNSIFWGNMASSSNNEIYNSSTSKPTFSHCDIKEGGGSSSWDTNFGIDGSNNIDSSPMFATASKNASHPYSLTGISPCVDAGNNDANSESYDIRGDYGRKINGTTGATGGTIDIGAYEYKLGTDPTTPPRYYVNVNANGSNNGTSWADAYTSLQSALDVAASGGEIWVAKGTYKPSAQAGGAGTRFQTFQMINGVSIYGGFAGNETTPSARATYGVGEVNETILSGDIGTVNDNSDNCYHVFYHPDETNLNSTAVLDGFTITRGNADGVGSTSYYYGGGMYNYGSSPTVINSTFCDNSATGFGGGMCNSNASPTVTNSTFSSNNSGTYGGGIFNYSSDPTVTNSTFRGNNAESGGGMFNYSSDPTITNSTFSGNSASDGGGMYNFDPSSPTVTNSIFWGNSASSEGDEIYTDGSSPTFSYCDIKGSGGSGDGNWDTYLGNDNGNNIDSNPMFVDSGNHPYAIVGVSPCADAGNSETNSEIYDIRGVGYARKLNKNDGTTGTIDIGAYEYKFNTDPLPVELTSFIAEIIEEGVLLKWVTVTEVNNYGFEVERQIQESSVENQDWGKVGFVEGHGNSNSPKSYEFIDDLLTLSVDSLEYRLKQIDTDGGYKCFGQTVKIDLRNVTDLLEESLPTKFELLQNYPNPFNPTTIIRYELPVSQNTGTGMAINVKLIVYDMLGREVVILVNKQQSAGRYTVSFDARSLTSGVYFYILKTNSGFIATKKLMLIK